MAFYDINPQAKVHFLVVPKKHIQSCLLYTSYDSAVGSGDGGKWIQEHIEHKR